MVSTAEGIYTEPLAHYCANARLEDIPLPIRERAKHVILDGIGCGLYGARLPWSEILIQTIAPLSAGGQLTVWGPELRLPPHHGAPLNGSFVQGFQLHDAPRGGGLHEC